jgi:hypothetical protein
MIEPTTKKVYVAKIRTLEEGLAIWEDVAEEVLADNQEEAVRIVCDRHKHRVTYDQYTRETKKVPENRTLLISISPEVGNPNFILTPDKETNNEKTSV